MIHGHVDDFGLTVGVIMLRVISILVMLIGDITSWVIEGFAKSDIVLLTYIRRRSREMYRTLYPVCICVVFVFIFVTNELPCKHNTCMYIIELNMLSPSPRTETVKTTKRNVDEY